MNCPHCQKLIHGWTGLMELQKFLGKCRKNPENHLTDGKLVVKLGKQFDLNDALRIRAKSGQ